MTKRATTILVLSLLAAGGGAFAQASDGENLATLVTTELVRSALLDRAAAKAMPIVVTMDHGTAILTGDVESKVVQELAKEVALSVDGVRDVDNRLRVVGEKPFSQQTIAEARRHDEQEFADARLESGVKLALYREIGARAGKLEIEAVDGVVSVRGPVPDEARRKIALDTVNGLQGVKKVIDLMKVGG